MRWALILLLFISSCSFGVRKTIPTTEYINEISNKNYDLTYAIVHNYKQNSFLFTKIEDIKIYSQLLKINIDFEIYQNIWIESNSEKRIIIHFTLKQLTINNETYHNQDGLIMIMSGDVNKIKMPEYRKGNIFTSFTFSQDYKESNIANEINSYGYVADLFIPTFVIPQA